MSAPLKCLIGDKWVTTSDTADVINPFNGRKIASVCLAGRAEMRAAIKAAEDAFKITRNMSAYDTSSLLKRAVHGLIRNKKRLTDAIVAEAGKPVTLAEQEVDRTIMAFSIAGEEANRQGGELLPVDVDPRGAGRYAIVKRFPIGVVGGISPFNFPLNLVAHKVAPVIAAKNTIVLKPATKTPMSAIILGEILLTAGMTPGQYNVVPCDRNVGELLATDDRIAKLTFTGSPPVGWYLKQLAYRKKVTLELGGNAAVVVCEDADLKWAVPRIVAGAFGYAGQVCISVQRILVHKSVFDKTVKRLVEETKKLKTGNPCNKAVSVGPMINRGALKQTVSWVNEAVENGAKVLIGGKAKGACYLPTIISDVNRKMKVVCEEAFAPVAVVQPFNNFAQAINMVNDSVFGLQMGVFTTDLDNAFTAFEEAQVGGVIVNDFPTFRVDNMPYGGVKDSGFGREGIKYAIDEMTETKVLVIKK